MIASLTGRVSHVGLDSVILDVNGFGMLVHATARTLAGLHLGGDCHGAHQHDCARRIYDALRFR